MIAARWTWLHADLDASGVECKVDQRGRDGAAFIEFRLPDGDWFAVHDHFVRGRWAGWNVSRQDRDGFGIDIIRSTKDRNAVVTAARKAIKKGVTS